MTLETLMIIAAVVAAFGALSSQFFRKSGSAYILTISGTRAQLIATGALIWIAAIAFGLIALIVVSAVISSVVALAIFFGVEAVALDIFVNRTRYQRVNTEHSGRIRVSALNRT